MITKIVNSGTNKPAKPQQRSGCQQTAQPPEFKQRSVHQNWLQPAVNFLYKLITQAQIGYDRNKYKQL